VQMPQIRHVKRYPLRRKYKLHAEKTAQGVAAKEKCVGMGLYGHLLKVTRRNRNINQYSAIFDIGPQRSTISMKFSQRQIERLITLDRTPNTRIG
jgi:hypothetical protein